MSVTPEDEYFRGVFVNNPDEQLQIIGSETKVLTLVSAVECVSPCTNVDITVEIVAKFFVPSTKKSLYFEIFYKLLRNI